MEGIETSAWSKPPKPIVRATMEKNLLVPKLHLGMQGSPQPRCFNLGGSPASPTSAFPSTTWERGYDFIVIIFSSIWLEPAVQAARKLMKKPGASHRCGRARRAGFPYCRD